MPALQLSRRKSLVLLSALLLNAGAGSSPAQESRPTNWATPMTLAGVPNLFQVSPTIFRSAQPTREGFLALPTIDVKTVINLRRRVEDAPLAEGSGLTTLHIKITTRHITADNGKAIVRALRALRDEQARGPVLVHCTHGADRTGMIIALWRMLYEGWTREAAITELKLGGYGFHQVWINIPRYLADIDLGDLKSRVEAT